MIKMHMPLWDLLASAAALGVLTVLSVRGRSLARRLRGPSLRRTRAAPSALRSCRKPVRQEEAWVA